MNAVSLLRTTALLLLLLCVTPLRAEWGIAQLMQTMANNKGGKASFVEKSYISLLDMPVTATGELIFTAPDHLEKRTLKPSREIMVLDGDTLTIERDEQKHTMKLSDYPEVAAFIESIRGTLAGDQQSLERQYKLTLSGTPQRWKLTLVPRNSRMATILQRILIEGAQGTVRSVEFSQAGGDHSTMTITKIATP